MSYWIGQVGREGFAFILTSPIKIEQGLPDLWRHHLSPSGHTYSLDFCIGNRKYLGKGFAAPTLQAFMSYFKQHVDTQADKFFIDPDADNSRACHVYAKAGFESVGFYELPHGFFAGQESELMVAGV